MAKTYPITKANDINNYIDQHHALSYMNSFREFGIYPPGLNFANTPIKSLGYSLPQKSYMGYIIGMTGDLFKEFKYGEKTLDEISFIFKNPKTEIKKLKEKVVWGSQIQKHTVFPDEKEFEFNLVYNLNQYDPERRKYYGGRKRKTRRKIANKKRQTKRC